MTNLYVPSRYDERIWRLALGLEPMDAVRGLRIGHEIQVTFDEKPLGLPRPAVPRHRSGLFVLVHGEGIRATLTLRLFDLGEPTDPPGYRGETNRRRFVPRRLRVTIPGEAGADAVAVARRARRAALFPGVAYDASESVTGLRGSVRHSGGAPARWARVEARLPGTTIRVGRAHCDERGEFLLLPGAAAAPRVDLELPFELDLLAYRANPPLPIPSAEIGAADELWDLPIESLSVSGEPDAVAAGEFPPVGWTAAAAAVPTPFSYGRLRRERTALLV